MHIPRILIAAPASGSGKTAVTCALLAALKARGLRVRACKCGPDYIDPMFHREAVGVDSRNLDLFFSGKDGIRDELSRHGADADLVVAEGVMGYYDGRSVDTDEGSSYDVARTLEMPVLLVVNGRGAALSPGGAYQRDGGIPPGQQYPGDPSEPCLGDALPPAQRNAGERTGPVRP